jgi:hypothetical protein
VARRRAAARRAAPLCAIREPGEGRCESSGNTYLRGRQQTSRQLPPLSLLPTSLQPAKTRFLRHVQPVGVWRHSSRMCSTLGIDNAVAAACHPLQVSDRCPSPVAGRLAAIRDGKWIAVGAAMILFLACLRFAGPDGRARLGTASAIGAVCHWTCRGDPLHEVTAPV